MRKIEKAMCAAVESRTNWAENNTRVEVKDGGSKVSVYLHGNKIYSESSEGWRMFSLAGWDTTTTRSRLNALGIRVYRRKGVLYYDGHEIDSTGWYEC